MTWFLTIDIGGTKIAAVRYGHELQRIGEPALVAASEMKSAADVVAQIVDFAGDDLSGLAGVGISVAGSIDSRAGRVHHSPNCTWLDNAPLQAEVQRALAVPVAVENDANCFALAEARLGAAAGRQHVVGITLGTGVGGGIVIDGRVLQGSGIGAGELGHVCINFDGPRCTCGSTGCIEAYIAGWAIPRTATALFENWRGKTSLEGTMISGEDLNSAARAGDEFARVFWYQYATWLGIAATTWVNMLRPEAIVFGGSGAASFDLFYPQLMITLRERVLPPMYERMLVCPAKCEFPGNLGAALALQDRLATL